VLALPTAVNGGFPSICRNIEAQAEQEEYVGQVVKGLEAGHSVRDGRNGIARASWSCRFERIWVSTGLTKRPRVVGATVQEPLMVLAQALPEHLRGESEAAPSPELAFLRVGSNSDFLVALAGAYSNPNSPRRGRQAL
jgi:hypothetical protein